MKAALTKLLVVAADLTGCISFRLSDFFDRQAWRLNLPTNPATTPEQRRAVREEFIL